MKTVLAVLTLSIALAFFAGVRAASSPPKFAPQVQHISHTQVADAITKGKVAGQPPVPLIDRDMELCVRVNVGRKGPQSPAEVHSIYGHVFFVQSGSGTVVLGGELVDPKENRPGEWTGSSTRGGKEYRMETGDMITVQVGMPHWWKDVSPDGIVFLAFHSYPDRNQDPGVVKAAR